ncbi:MAG: N-acetyl-gamma-glutamyl-phosphate reductase [Oceanipulchritudo sp.]
MKKIGIIGASGYSGEVLVELLAGHPKVKELTVASRTYAGKRVDEVLPRLAGLVTDLTFTEANPKALAKKDVDVWFLALPHGVSSVYALPLVEAGKVVIDLSADFRLNSEETYAAYYGQEHAAPEWLQKVPYVLPEIASPGWKKASLIACPGCYPTSILLPLLPLVREKLLSTEHIVIHSMSGVSGAGKKEALFYSFCERSDSVLPYGLGRHRHLAEIEEQLCMVARKAVMVQFTPHLVPMMRGIASTIVIRCAAEAGEVYASWEKAFGKKQGVNLLSSGQSPDTRNVLGRNRIEMAAFKDGRTGNLLITSAIDNLMKGAGSQAVQIMNLRLGWPEFAGLS